MRQDPRAMLAAMADVPEAVDPEVRRFWLDQAGRAGHDPSMAMQSHVFRVQVEQVGAEGWYTLAGIRRGPFGSPEAMEASVLEVMAAWKIRAHELGGWCWRRTATEIVVTLPDDIQVDGSEPLTAWVGKSPRAG